MLHQFIIYQSKCACHLSLYNFVTWVVNSIQFQIVFTLFKKKIKYGLTTVENCIDFWYDIVTWIQYRLATCMRKLATQYQVECTWNVKVEIQTWY